MSQTLLNASHSDLVIRKSRFIGCVQPISNRSAARAVLDALRAQHPQATHLCWALLAGGESAAVDDGEPSGTAGRPMLEVLRHQDLDGVLATAVRYFGGIKLGAGGLIRAYAQCIAQALDGADKVPIVRIETLCCETDYALENRVRRSLEEIRGRLVDVQYGRTIRFTMQLPEDAADELRRKLENTTRGQITWHRPDAPAPDT